MKKACILIFAALLAGSALDVAQDMSSILQGTPPSCAPAPQNLKPRADPASLEPGIPPPGKSLVYVIDADPNRLARILGVCVDSFAVDVLRGRSAFSLVLDPSEHDFEIHILDWNRHAGFRVIGDPISSVQVKLTAGQVAYIAVAVHKGAQAGGDVLGDMTWEARIWNTNGDEGKLLLASTANGGTGGAALTASEASCGPSAERFRIHMVKESGSQPAPQDKARVYFIGRGESAAGSGIIGPVRVGMDGDWVGAVKGRSYLAVAAPPGVHHFCAEWPGNRGINGVALNLLDLKPGQAYYLVVNSLSDPATPPDVLMLHEEAAREALPILARSRMAVAHRETTK